MFKGFASFRQSLTLLVYLRRISRSLHRANELAEARLMLDYPAWYKSSTNTIKSPTSPHTSTTRNGKLADLNAPTIEDWNRAYNDRHPNTGTEDFDDEHNIS